MHTVLTHLKTYHMTDHGHWTDAFSVNMKKGFVSCVKEEQQRLKVTPEISLAAQQLLAETTRSATVICY